MRYVVTGVDWNGKSCIITNEELPRAGTAMGGFEGAPVRRLWATTTSPPAVDRPVTGPVLDVGVAPGATQWVVWTVPPGEGADMHRTDTIDYDVVLSGSINLLLETGSVTLHAGDCAVVTGVVHGWRARAAGAVLSSVTIGLAT